MPKPPIPSPEIVDEAWSGVLAGNTNAILLILLALTVFVILWLMHKLSQKDKVLERHTDRYVTLAVGVMSAIDISNERSKRQIEMLDYLTRKKPPGDS